MTVIEAIEALCKLRDAGRGHENLRSVNGDKLQVDSFHGDVTIRGDTMNVDLWYPRNSGVQHVEVDLIDVRASDGVRVSYDFDRDGFVIEQPVWSPDEDTGCEDITGWLEVHFCPAWRYGGLR